MSNIQLTENLNSILDNFQMVVGSGMTTRSPITLHSYREYDSRGNMTTYKKISGDVDVLSQFDGLYPIDPKSPPQGTGNYQIIGSRFEPGCRSKEILMETPVSDTDKELLKEWFLSGGNVKNYQYDDEINKGMDYLTWYRFTKGLLWKFYNYLLVNLEDKNLETIDERLTISLMDLIYDQTSQSSRYDKEEWERSKTLEERYGNPETQKLEQEIEELKKELERKEMELESLVV